MSKFGPLRKIGGFGETTYLKPSEMKKGQKVAGTFLKTLYSEQYEQTTYIVDTENGTVGLNGCGHLDFAMKNVAPGSYVEIIYAGQTKLAKGAFKGKPSHQFEVYVADALDAPSAKNLAVATTAPIANIKNAKKASQAVEAEEENDENGDDFFSSND